MRSENEHKNLQGAPYRELRLLEEVGFTPEISQRHLARRLGIALGVTNVLLKTLAKKGYIRMVQVRWKNWVYILTPAGIAHRVQLTIAYIEGFFDHYRRVRDFLSQDLGALTLDPESNIAIYGATELAELAFLALRDLGITNIEVFDSEPSSRKFLGMTVHGPEMIASCNRAKVLVAFSSDGEKRTQELLDAGVDQSQIVILLRNF